eukprot:1196275-Prorocentrum_minimum.AAC.2
MPKAKGAPGRERGGGRARAHHSAGQDERAPPRRHRQDAPRHVRCRQRRAQGAQRAGADSTGVNR